MKKSEIYHLAQVAVLNTPTISPETKLEALAVLIDDERVAQYSEEQDEKEG